MLDTLAASRISFCMTQNERNGKFLINKSISNWTVNLNFEDNYSGATQVAISYHVESRFCKQAYACSARRKSLCLTEKWCLLQGPLLVNSSACSQELCGVEEEMPIVGLVRGVDRVQSQEDAIQDCIRRAWTRCTHPF